MSKWRNLSIREETYRELEEYMRERGINRVNDAISHLLKRVRELEEFYREIQKIIIEHEVSSFQEFMLKVESSLQLERELTLEKQPSIDTYDMRGKEYSEVKAKNMVDGILQSNLSDYTKELLIKALEKSKHS